MSITLASELESSLISFAKKKGGGGGGGGGLFKGGNYIKYIHQGEVIIQGRWLIERCLLFEEIWYFAFIKELPPSPPKYYLKVYIM